LFSNDYIDDLLVRLAHHSSAIENNTITLQETVSILLYNTIPNKASLREVYEIDNHRFAFEYILDSIKNKETLTFEVLFKTHSILLERLHHERGKFKTNSNAIVGADFTTASVQETPILMKQWLDNINYRLENSSTKEEIVEAVCESHIQFEKIHPFQDGNGRTGRLIMSYLLMLNDIAPLVIEKEDKGDYILYLANEDVEGFTSYALKKISDEEVRMTSFPAN